MGQPPLAATSQLFTHSCFPHCPAGGEAGRGDEAGETMGGASLSASSQPGGGGRTVPGMLQKRTPVAPILINIL